MTIEGRSLERAIELPAVSFVTRRRRANGARRRYRSFSHRDPASEYLRPIDDGVRRDCVSATTFEPHERHYSNAPFAA